MSQRRLLKRATGVGLAVAMLSLPLLSGCTALANKDQLAMLDEARKRAESAEAEVTFRSAEQEIEVRLVLIESADAGGAGLTSRIVDRGHGPLAGGVATVACLTYHTIQAI